MSMLDNLSGTAKNISARPLLKQVKLLKAQNFISTRHRLLQNSVHFTKNSAELITLLTLIREMRAN